MILLPEDLFAIGCDAIDPALWEATLDLLNPEGLMTLVAASLFLVVGMVILYTLLISASPAYLVPAAFALGFGLVSLRGTGSAPTVFPPPPLTPLPLTPKPEEETVAKHYHWQYSLGLSDSTVHSFQFDLAILRRHLDYYRSQPRIADVGQWGKYVVSVSPEALEAAHQLRSVHEANHFSTFDEMSDTVCFVQHFPYSLDEQSTGRSEYPRYPLETLHDETGDCECLSILGASLLELLGYEAVLLEYPGHIALGVGGADLFEGAFFVDQNTGRRYYYAEVTASHWRVGEVPDDFRGITPRMIPIPPDLILLRDEHLPPPRPMEPTRPQQEKAPL